MKKKHPRLPSDQKWLDLAAKTAAASPHPSVKVGALITTPDGKRRIASGVNAPPDGIALTKARLAHGEKSLWFMCAEKQALALAQARKHRFGLKNLRGCRIYSTLEPCHTCAHDIIQAGLGWVCVPADAQKHYPKLKKKYRRSMEAAAAMFAEKKIKTCCLS